MEKSCPLHGDYETLIWQDDSRNYMRWLQYGGMDIDRLAQSPEELGLESVFSCENSLVKPVKPCSAALMVTNRCNADCPVCFTRSYKEKVYEPDLLELKNMLIFYKEKAGEGAPLEFCGGEPTVRKDLPELASMARAMGFDYIQLNTNGIALSASADYCRSLKNSGITTAYLGFDGVTAKPYYRKYGRDLLQIKKQAVVNCREAGLAVVLVPCVIPDVNDGELGDIIRFAKENIPTVKGVYFQPISYFGICPSNERPRITIPKILRLIEKQTDGEIPVNSFLPGNYEHPQCSFGGYYLLNGEGRLSALTRFKEREYSPDAYVRIRAATKKTWQPNEQKYLTIGGMAFQDAWNLDIARLRRCTINIIGKDNHLIPLCSKYLTSSNGKKIYPGIA